MRRQPSPPGTEPDLPPLMQPPEQTKAGSRTRARALCDLAVREGDQAYGAVVVCDGVSVGEGRSSVALPTAQAELLAVRTTDDGSTHGISLIAADYQLGRRRERDCTLMVSGEMPAARQRITENASCIARLPRMSAGTMPYDAMADPAMIEATMKAAEPAPEPSCFRIRVTL